MYAISPNSPIERRFVKVGERIVHFRTSGSGPALLLFHQSPTSSAELISEIETFASSFTVIAADTPGYGWSDPLPIEHPAISDFGDAVIELMNALNISTAGVFGSHTGAMIAADLAARHSDRVSAAVLDGYVVLEDSERIDLLANYFNKPQPSPDGAHLAWAWARIRDQMIFFPWYSKERGSRMQFDVAPAAALQPYFLDLARAYHGGVPAYRAAFEYDARAAAVNFAAPTWLLNYSADAIAGHPERLAAMSDQARREMCSDPVSLSKRAIEIFRSRPAHPVVLPTASDDGLSIVTMEGSELCLRKTGSGVPVLLVHEPGASMAQWDGLTQRSGFRWHLIDLPGHGRSGPDSGATSTFRPTFKMGLAKLIEEHRIQAVVTMGDSGWLVAESASTVGVPHLAIDLDDDPSVIPVPDLTPEDYGGHLLRAWYVIRDSELFHPWSKPTLARSLDREFALDPASLTRRTIDLLIAAPSLATWKDRAVQAAARGTLPALKFWRKASRPLMTSAAPNVDTELPDQPKLFEKALLAQLKSVI
jgi:pimeloyl-ACP methyl ester carboxylesterase